MKKILVAIALMLVASFLISIPAMGAISTDGGSKDVTLEEVLNSGILGDKDIHYVGAPTTVAPKQDGVINEGEYSYFYRDENVTNTAQGWSSGSGGWYGFEELAVNEYTKAHSEYVDVYFSYDNDYVYIAISDPGFYFDNIRHNTSPNIFPKIGIRHDDLDYGYAPQITQNGGTKTEANLQAAETYKIDGYSIKGINKFNVTKTNLEGGGCSYVHEYRYSKAESVKVLNDRTKANVTEFPNTFFFTVGMCQYMGTSVRGDNMPQSWVRMVGRPLTSAERVNLGTDYFWWIPAVVVLGENPNAEEAPETTTEAPTTEAPTTEPATEAPTTEAPTTAPVTEAPTTEPAATEPATTEPAATEPATTEPAPEKGCGNSIGLMGLALVATLGTCAVVATKKKED